MDHTWSSNSSLITVLLRVAARPGAEQRDTVIQNRLAKVQLLRDRFEMYWRTYSPVTDEHIRDAMLYPEDYMPVSVYEGVYRNDKERLRKYIAMTKLYEYLVFMHASQQLDIDDPLGKEWLPRWVSQLSTDQQFLEVNEYYRPYYEKFSGYVHGIRQRRSG